MNILNGNMSGRGKTSLIAVFAGLALGVYLPAIAGSSLLNLQFEGLTTNSSPPNVAADDTDSDARGGTQSEFSAFDLGHWVEYSVYIDEPGTFRIKARSEHDFDRGTLRLFVDDRAQGIEVDQYAPSSEFVTTDYGLVTFLKTGYKIFKFEVSGKNDSSSGYSLSFDELELEPSVGFTLLSPNESYTGDSQPVLRWSAQPEANRYQVFVDGVAVGEVEPGATSYQTKDLAQGLHQWHVVASGSDLEAVVSNTLSFYIGDAPAYQHRNFSDDFETASLELYHNSGMSESTDAIRGRYSLSGAENTFAMVKDVSLEKTGEGEVAATIRLNSAESKAGVGFRADDGTFIYALADAETDTLRIERKVRGYSILDTRVTPFENQMVDMKGRHTEYGNLPEWEETRDGEFYVWTLSSSSIDLDKDSEYELKLSYSRRSMAVMANLESADGSSVAVTRSIADLRTMHRPALICSGGDAIFDDFKYARIDAITTKWDPDTIQVVMTPSKGTWDQGATFNPAVVHRDGLWHMIYRGQAVPAPGDGFWGQAASDIGYATSLDGVNWTKYQGNPVIAKDPITDSIEDPDILMGDDGYIYMELRDHDPHDGEVMYRSKDFINWEFLYDIALPTSTSLPGKGFKIGAFLDTHTSPKFDPENPEAVEIDYEGKRYRYLGTIERGRLIVSDDLEANDWVYLERYADYNSAPPTDWNPMNVVYIGDAFFDQDGNIRASGQASPAHRVGGNPACTNLEVVLDGTQPWNVLHTARLPYLQGWYGRAPTGSLDEFTAWDGSTFPGNTIEKDGWLWLFNGANNTMNGLIKCYNNHVFETRNLTLSEFAPKSEQEVTVTAIVRNTGNVRGSDEVALMIDGSSFASKTISLERDAEIEISFTISKPTGTYTIGVGTATATMLVE